LELKEKMKIKHQKTLELLGKFGFAEMMMYALTGIWGVLIILNFFVVVAIWEHRSKRK
jgi:uncharacterized membrane protein YuzA (DUF378 family)